MACTTRSYGSHVALQAIQEVDYGVPPTTGYRNFIFKSSTLGEAQNLTDPNILGQGRDDQVPHRDIVVDDGDLVVPLDLRHIGFWLKNLLGPVQTAVIEQTATGTLKFLAQPVEPNTITINGQEVTYVDAAPGANEILIGASILDTLNNTQVFLDAAGAPINVATYTDDDVDLLTITHDTPGTGGNSFTLETNDPNIQLSGATLKGGAYVHEFHSGVDCLPSFTVEIEHKNPSVFFQHIGCVLNSLGLNFQRSGEAEAALNIIAKGQRQFDATQAGTPVSPDYVTRLFNQFQGSILKDDVALGNITGATLNYTNSVESVQTIRPDAEIEAADPTIAKASGEIVSRFANTTLLDDAVNDNDIKLELAYIIDAGQKIVFTLHKVLLPRPKVAIEGPGAVQTTFAWQAAKDDGVGRMMTAKLYNDVATYGA